MIDIIYMHGGDVIKFAGDALLVVWRRGSAEDARRASTTYVVEGWR
jgi:class 3 adenylate cyclase